MNDWYAQIPKAELHLHLEGSIPLDTLWELVEKYGGHSEAPTREALSQRFRYRDFPHFIETWVWKNQFLKSYEDFTFIAEAVARDLLRQNIVYVEAFCSPADFARHGLAPGRLLEAMRTGFSAVDGITIQLVVDLIRDFGPERGRRVLDEVAEAREFGVVGIGIGGSEQKFPPEPWSDVYTQARTMGFKTSAHAGEVAGAPSVWGAVSALEVDRIGHGTRAIEDSALMALLAERQIPIEMCPLSNVCTGVVADLAAHPVRQFFDQGLLITINTDDPAMFGNNLADEFRKLASVHHFTQEEIVTLVLNGVRASWLEDEAKVKMLASFRDQITRIG